MGMTHFFLIFYDLCKMEQHKSAGKDLFGLIGYPLSHSFSKKYFTTKFKREHIQEAEYELYPLEQIEDLPILLATNPNIRGLNVTIPYKQVVLSYLDELDETAAKIGAVNCIEVGQSGRLKGYNTDAIGFEQSLCYTADGRWAATNTKALVLGNGGAARAVAFVLGRRGIPFYVVSRKKEPIDTLQSLGSQGVIAWEDISPLLTQWERDNGRNPILIVNTTPLGMAPYVEDCPNLPFDQLGDEHFVFDLIYNPEETVLLRRAKERGCITQNGLEMLHLQAEAAWQIWRS